MPTGIPRLGQAAIEDHEKAKEFPGGEVLGEIKAKPVKVAVWDDEELNAQIAIEQGPPPWETQEENLSNARNFIECPKDWELRWINPRLLDQEGWRGWSPVRARDPRIKVKVNSMISPEYQIRRGGHGGDILAYMPKDWFETRRKQYYRMVSQRTQSSVDRTSGLRERIRSDSGGLITVESATHPTHTMAQIDKDAP